MKNLTSVLNATALCFKLLSKIPLSLGANISVDKQHTPPQLLSLKSGIASKLYPATHQVAPPCPSSQLRSSFVRRGSMSQIYPMCKNIWRHIRLVAAQKLQTQFCMTPTCGRKGQTDEVCFEGYPPSDCANKQNKTKQAERQSKLLRSKIE